MKLHIFRYAVIFILATASFAACLAEDLPVSVTIEGVMTDKKSSVALINGQIYRTGDMIEDVKIIEITNRYVKVDYEGVIYTLPVGSGTAASQEERKPPDLQGTVVEWFRSFGKKPVAQPKPQKTPDIVKEQPLQEIADKEKAEQEQVERERIVKETAAREQAERERIAKEKAAREQTAQEQAVRELRAQEQAERERIAKEKSAQEQAERERIAKEQAAREQTERERIVKEKAAQEQAERERIAKEQAAREQAERERLAKEKAVPAEPDEDYSINKPMIDQIFNMVPKPNAILFKEKLADAARYFKEARSQEGLNRVTAFESYGKVIQAAAWAVRYDPQRADPDSPDRKQLVDMLNQSLSKRKRITESIVVDGAPFGK
jgi:hypothetical protein